jgi:MYXO-CTERM domain-containing protein
MRRISLASLAMLIAAPSSAFAAHHFMRISEVLLSEGGDDAVQFIELTDVNDESFPSTYVLAVYYQDGALVDSQAIDPPANTNIYLVASSEWNAGSDPNGNELLDVDLPAEGQVCFELAAGDKIACASWGCINTKVDGENDTGTGAAPPDGMSLQRQGVNNYTVGEPTPGAANAAGTPIDACSTDVDAGTGDPDAGTDDADAGADGPDGGGGGGGGGGDNDDDDSGCGCGVKIGGTTSGTLVLMAFAILVGLRRRRS